MTILALDSSSKAASCALMRDGALVAEFFANMGLTHSQILMPMVESMLKLAKVSPDEVELFAVTVGPGSFTGLRIGMAAAKGMAFAAGKSCAAVSTLESLAHNLPEFQGAICPVMDARCGQVYTALFHREGQTLRRLEEDRAISLEERLQSLRLLAPGPVLLVGDGAELCAGRGEGLDLRLAPERLRHQRAGSVAFAALEKPTISPEEMDSVYLRLPQAERERNQREGKQ